MHCRGWKYVAFGTVLFLLPIHLLVVADEGSADAKPTAKRPQELGTINWRRGFDAAADEARQADKPLLVLFQEVPGCGTCKSYGDRVLSHPLIRDAVESCFIPVAVYNNIPGDDRRVLKKFKEPEWNNPVVRIMRHDRTELASRVTGDYTTTGLVSAMVESLNKIKRPVPDYLRLLNDELSARKRGLQRATFSMHCFWEGEAQLGGVDGVVATLPGFVQGKEVVDVWYDENRVSYVKLVQEGRRMKCASTIFARSDQQDRHARSIGDLPTIRSDDRTRPDKEPKYYLSKTLYRFVPMTETQAARVNAAIRENHDPKRLLAPCQLRLLERIAASPDANWPNAIGHDDLIRAFADAHRIANDKRERVSKRG